MNRIDLLQDTKDKIDEINRKTAALKDKSDQYRDQELTSRANDVLRQLEKIRDELQEQYPRFWRLEYQTGNQLNEFEKNIFKSIKLLNNAFTEAGSLLKPK